MQAAQQWASAPKQGKQLALSTFAGATARWRRPERAAGRAAQARHLKGGTTYAALTSMEASGVKDAFVKAIAAARQRARNSETNSGADPACPAWCKPCKPGMVLGEKLGMHGPTVSAHAAGRVTSAGHGASNPHGDTMTPSSLSYVTPHPHGPWQTYLSQVDRVLPYLGHPGPLGRTSSAPSAR